ncbi:calcium ATPase [Guyanagaster necrorhizus]|uniref:Calcium ATPase n=1 Tax=Guyanagaster necrorhizus TaxID=856835 RepID=A0A9P8AQ21_9AGAR|nr:calcium ATPase [Guyanagaster necrorhizus MCA 3950]KAG7443376.1 calcium ATPase [Guyanagaster necrorhizus MCA 3950]
MTSQIPGELPLHFDVESLAGSTEKELEEPPHVLVETRSRNDGTALALRRSASVYSQGVNMGAKIPGEFRTLSINVTETKEGATNAKAKTIVKEIADLDWHELDTLEVLTRLGVSEKNGLDGPMVARRLTQNGKNVITPPPKNLTRRIFFYIFGGFGSLLFIASIICFLSWRPLGDPDPATANLALAVVLLIVLAIQAVFNAWQDFTTSRTMKSIAAMLPLDVLVTRDGHTLKVPAPALVLGDIVHVTMGCKVPADLRLIDVSSDLKFDRSILTGESNAVPATVEGTDPSFIESRNIALQGTLCVSGDGLGVCVCLGDNTVFGRIAKQAASERPGRTSLESEILRIVLVICSLAIAIDIIVIILWAAWLRRDYPGFISVPVLLIDLVSVAVAFIPEGLPVCVTLSLTVIAGAMRKANILCKSLSTVESLGCVNFIASDKTGTLTKNKMTVVNVAIGNELLTASEAREAAVGNGPAGERIQILAATAGICNDARFDNTDDELPVEIRKVHGDATDTGLLRFSESIMPIEDSRAAWIERAKLAFNSKNKFAMKLLQALPQEKPITSMPIFSNDDFNMSSDYVLLVKGAPEIVLRRCSHMMDSKGLIVPMDETIADRLSAIQEQFASNGQRVLLMAKKIIHGSKLPTDFFVESGSFPMEDRILGLNSDLTVVGLVALIDPPRDDVKETVAVARRASVRFAMVTGDFSSTAAAIAQQVGIITTPMSEVKHIKDLPYDASLESVAGYEPEIDRRSSPEMRSLVLSGSDLVGMTESQWKQALAFDEIVFARTTPQQKLQIVKKLQAEGCTVAVTGDGVNDSPALKQADVGVAIAGGSEVAMEAADLILLSDFSAIITGIQYGRLCFENLRKSILYLLPAGSFSELMPVVLNVLTGVPQALSSFQMIIICVFTDVSPALSMVNEKPEADLLLRRPRDRKKDRLINWRLLLHAYFFLGIIEAVTSMVGAFYFGFQRNGVPFSALWLKYGGYDADPDLVKELTNKAQSIYFYNLVMMQWFNLLGTRTRRLSLFQQNPFSSKTRNIFLFPAMAAALVLACFFSYIPWFQQVLLTRGIHVEFFFLPIAYGIGMLFLDEARKWWNRKHPTSFLARIAW